ncbi:glycosyltransferase family 2 protein [Pedobacter sp. UBA5917]|uniref:glycosyltransferase family 2 protein n=1 Tax=Pedobacter sp. UBA5917 TaxID=1947061 RepID=UPI0025E1B44A|nr:glycosyltransferase family 2 protein [Pedobacter sp. UBA5917]
MSNKALVSICIPCYNAANYLTDTLNALLKQRYSYIEVIVADNLSNDGSAEIISSFSRKDPRIKYVNCKKKGAAAARNYAFQESKGEYIIFLDADDWVNEHYVSELLLTCNRTKDCIVACAYQRFFNNDVNKVLVESLATWKNLKPIEWLLIDNGKGLGMMQSGMFLIPRNLLLKAGGWNEELSLIDDFEFFPRLLLTAEKILFCKQAILYYRSGNRNTLSGNSSSKSLHSVYLALQLTTQRVLKEENSLRAKAIMANYWALWAYHFYPKEKLLLKEAQKSVWMLSGKKLSPPQSGLSKKISKIFGWKLTKRIKDILF